MYFVYRLFQNVAVFFKIFPTVRARKYWFQVCFTLFLFFLYFVTITISKQTFKRTPHGIERLSHKLVLVREGVKNGGRGLRGSKDMLATTFESWDKLERLVNENKRVRKHSD